MSEENVEIMRQANAAFNRGDLEGALANYADDAEMRDLLNAPDQPVVVSGIEAIRSVLNEWVAAFDELRADVEEWIDADDAVIIKAHWWGTGRESGLSIDSRQYDLYELHEGKIVRSVIGYGSRDKALEAAELSE
jgi:ketosteroid isomerase-like protein